MAVDVPTKTDDSIGREKSDKTAATDLDTQVPAEEWERFKTSHIDLVVDHNDHGADAANPHTTTTQQAVDAQGGSVVETDDTNPAIIEASAAAAAIEARTTAAATGPTQRLSHQSSGPVVAVDDGTDDLLELDIVFGEPVIHTPDAAVGTDPKSLTVHSGAGADGDANPTAPTEGAALIVRAGNGGADGGSGSGASAGGAATFRAGTGGSGGGAGGDAEFLAGPGGPNGEVQGPPGNAFLGAKRSVLITGSTAGFSNTVVFAGTAPTPTGHLDVVVSAEGDLDADCDGALTIGTSRAASIASGSGSTDWTHSGSIEADNLKKANLSAAAAPTVSDDDAAGYAVGSVWIDTTADRVWRCVDASTGAAIWNQIGGSIPLVEVAATALTLDDTHRGKRIVTTDASGCTITIPDTLDQRFWCEVVSQTDGQITMVPSGTMLMGLAPAFDHDNAGDGEARTAGKWSPATISVIELTAGTGALISGDLELV